MMFVRNKVFRNGHTSNPIDDEEFFVLSDLFEWKNTCFPYEDYTFNLNEMTKSE